MLCAGCCVQYALPFAAIYAFGYTNIHTPGIAIFFGATCLALSAFLVCAELQCLATSSPAIQWLLSVLACRAIDYNSFGPLVFPLLYLFFRPHPFGGERTLLDTMPSESDTVAQYTRLELYKDGLFFSLESVQVSPEERQSLLQQLYDLVNRIVEESPHPFDRYETLCSELFCINSILH